MDKKTVLEFIERILTCGDRKKAELPLLVGRLPAALPGGGAPGGGTAEPVRKGEGDLIWNMS